MFLRLPLRIRSHCLFVFHGPTFNALLPLCSIDNNLVRLFCLLPPLYPEFLINSTFHSFGSLMPKTWKVEDQHDRGFQRWILTTERFCGAADNIIARMEGRHSRLFIHGSSRFKSLSWAEQLALRSHASNAVRGIAWPRSFSRDLLQAGGGVHHPPSRPGQLCSGWFALTFFSLSSPFAVFKRTEASVCGNEVWSGSDECKWPSCEKWEKEMQLWRNSNLQVTGRVGGLTLMGDGWGSFYLRCN